MSVKERVRERWHAFSPGTRMIIALVAAVIAIALIWWLVAGIGGFFEGHAERKYQQKIAATEAAAQAAHDQAMQQKVIADQKAAEATQAQEELANERQAREQAEAEVDRLRANTTAARGRYDTARARAVPKRAPGYVPDDASLCADARAAGIQCP
jgi:hypothetical protein